MILLKKSYGGYPPNTIVQMSTDIERNLVATNIASFSQGPVTVGDVRTTMPAGRLGLKGGMQQVTVFNDTFTTESKFHAALSGVHDDVQAFYVTRIVPANGSVTFVLNDRVLEEVSLDWVKVYPFGGLTSNHN